MDLVEAADYAHESLAAANRAGITNLQATAQANLLLVLSAAGRWTELDAALSAADALRRSTYSDIAYVAHTLAALDRLQVPPAADTRGDRSSGAPADLGWYLLGDAAQALAAGDAVAALGHAAEAARVLRDLGGTYDDFVHAFGLAVDLAADLHDRERYAELLELVDGVPSPVAVQAYQARLHGLVAGDDGSPPNEVETAFRQSIELFEKWGASPERARSQCDLGLWLRAEGRVEEADQLLADARRTYEELGATGRLQALAAAGALSR
jgi:hypothetical protein